MSLDAATDQFLIDLTTFVELITRKLTGTTSAADNDDCNSQLREAFTKVERQCKDSEMFDVNEQHWQDLKKILWGWKEGEDVDEEEKFELCDWIRDLRNDGILPKELFEVTALAQHESR